MSKNFIKILSICFMLSVLQNAKATDYKIYVKALPDSKSATTISNAVKLTLQSLPNNGLQFNKIIARDKLHMTVSAVPSNFRPRALADVTNDNAREYRKDEFHAQVDKIAQALKGIPFMITSAANYGGENSSRKFIVLELQPQYKMIPRKQHRNLKRILNDGPHISLVVADVSNSNQNHNLLNCYRKLESWRKKANQADKQVKFDRVIAGYTTGPHSELCIYSTSAKKPQSRSNAGQDRQFRGFR